MARIGKRVRTLEHKVFGYVIAKRAICTGSSDSPALIVELKDSGIEKTLILGEQYWNEADSETKIWNALWAGAEKMRIEEDSAAASAENERESSENAELREEYIAEILRQRSDSQNSPAEEFVEDAETEIEDPAASVAAD